jgi:integrase
VVKKSERVGKKQLDEDKRSIEKVADWHKRNPKAIERAEFADLFLELHKKTGKPQVHLQKSLSNFYNYLLKKRGLVDYNPIPPVENYNPRDRVLRLEDLRAIWNYDFKTGVKYPDARWQKVYQLMIRTGGLRLGAILEAKMEEITTWKENGRTYDVWIIPAERMKRQKKNPFEHAVPITSDIGDLLTEVIDGRNDGYLFPHAFNPKEGVYDETRVMRPRRKNEMDEWRTALNITGEFKSGINRRDSVDPLDLKFSTDIRTTLTTQIIRNACGYSGDEANLVQGRISNRREGSGSHYDFAQMVSKKHEILTAVNKQINAVISDRI